MLASLLMAIPEVAAQQLPVRSFTAADGLAHDHINCIEGDSRGFLWFCTDDGLSRFDGRRFTSYGVAEGLSVARVNDFMESRDGRYWLTTTGGGVLLFEPVGSRPGLSKPRFTPVPGVAQGLAGDLLEDRQGQIWVTSLSGLYRLDREAGEFRSVRLDSPGFEGGSRERVEVTAAIEGADGSLWLGTGFGLVRRLPGGRLFHYPLVSREDEYIFSLVADEGGRIWTGHIRGLFVLFPEPIESLGQEDYRTPTPTLCRDGSDPPDGALFHLPTAPGQFCHYTGEDGLSRTDVRALYRGEDHIWIGAHGGITSFDGRRLRAYTERHGVVSRIRALAEDRVGNLWLGTAARGVERIARGGLRSYRQADGLGGSEVLSIFEMHTGELVVLNEGWTLSRFDGERFHAVRPRLPPRVAESGRGRWMIMQDHLAEWWVATGDGLYRFPRVERLEELAERAPRAVYDSTNGLAYDNVNRVFEDSRGDIWISAYFLPVKLVRWERATETFHHYGEADGLPADNWANVLAEDAGGQLWLGLHNGGLARRRGERFELFGPADGVPAGMMQGLYRDREGHLWLASGAGGAGRIDEPAAPGPRIVAGTAPGQLATANLFCFAEDDQDHLYFGTVSGLYRLHGPTGQIRHYTLADGLASSEVRVAFRDRFGSLWLGTHNGVSRLGSEPEEAGTPPDVWIDRLMIAGVEQPLFELGERAVGPLVLSPRQRRIEVGFFGLDFEPGGGLRYQYRLDPDAEWSSPTAQRTLAATLEPSRYRLEVRAVRGDGSVSPRPATLDLRILPPLWRRGWFVTSVALVVGIGLFWLYRLRVAQLLELERVRIRIATDLHDDIGAGLSRIAILSEVIRQRTDSAQRESHRLLGDIADSARGLVENMGDIVWSIDPRKDRLADLVTRVRLFAADLLDPKGITWRFDVEDGLLDVLLEHEQRRHLLLIFKESIHNIVRHSEADEVHLGLSLHDRNLRLEVRDNGRGLGGSEPGDRGRGGHGLRNFETRAAELGGALEVDSAFGRGTRLRVHVPFRVGRV